ncbi:MAG: hypothetical protein CVU81_00830 [Euryarchaeota archaeon HGW-Euryarchaeota-1]|nr:MAG: hypothetical protein CVU81_00830 [Euryarchaeota archaeon HGW-Euryarchaeota-1]
MVLIEALNIKKAYTSKAYFAVYLAILMAVSVLFLKYISQNIYGGAIAHTYFLLLVWISILMVIVPKLFKEAEEFCPINWHPIQKKWVEHCTFVERHKDVIFIFVIISILITVFFFIICYYNLLGGDFGTPQKMEMEKIKAVATSLSGYYSFDAQTGFWKKFSTIFQNNITVAILFFLLSVFEMFGALFLLSWNASLLGVWLSEIAKQASQHTSNLVVILSTTLTSFLGILPHTFFELGGFFLAAMAGGILAIGFSLYKDEALLIQTKDSILVLGAGLLFILIGAIIEAT